jgi:GNAT superfamily N-acetyltransferase
MENGLGVALFENGEMSGYLCCHNPFAFGPGKMTFSPIQAHGAIKNNPCKVYSHLYHSAAKLWVEQGISTHSIALYAHDKEGLDSFFWNGFGMYCIDAIRPVEPIDCSPVMDCEFIELPLEEIRKIIPLKFGLISHLSESPAFLKFPPFSEDQLIEKSRMRKARFFCAVKNSQIIAFVEITSSGENLVTYTEKMMNICGGFLVPEFRGSGIYANLLQYLIQQLKKEGYTRLGVDFESINPTAKGFWLKYFTPYTKSVVRSVIV